MSYPPANGGAIEVDDENDAASGYDSSDAQSSTQSLASSLNKYLEENGRRYHTYYGEDKVFMPNDEPEKNRLDLHHEIFRLITKGLYKAPLKNPQKILDLGTGTGIWCIDIADENPQAEVIGVDLSPIQPDWVPPNCKFEVDDVELEWTWPVESFDFIHARNILPSIKDIPKLFKNIYSRLKPGAYVQMGEIEGVFHSDDNSIPSDWPPVTCSDLTYKALSQIGCKFWTSDDIKKFVTDAGFVDVKVVVVKQPFGPWAKEKSLKQAGLLSLINAETLFHSYSLALYTRVLGMSEEEAKRVCDEARDAILFRTKKEKVHQYTTFFMVYGRKPEAS